jgi:UDP-N-acetylglucosamine 2-epimerase (non-hydrolysing)
VGSGDHADQTAEIMKAFKTVVETEAPDLVVVVGDVNSTVACSLVATKRQIPVAHVEAGLRSGDRSMPEEVNRIVTDRIADLLFVTEQSGVDNLRSEGVSDDKIAFVGNVMIDALVRFREKAAQTPIVDDLGLEEGGYVVMTMHRPSNVDEKDQLEVVLQTIQQICEDRPLVFPMHPRTEARIEEFGLEEELGCIDGLQVLPPQGYLEFLALMDQAGAVVTDSGGIQEETTFLGVPCITLRPNTERPVTIREGTNELMELNPGAVSRRVTERMGHRMNGQTPELWDGRTAERIVEQIDSRFHPAPVPSQEESR